MGAIENARILVTGGAGFIGSAMCRRLAKTCSKVVAYDNLCTGSYSFVEDLVSLGKLEFVNADLHDSGRLESELRRSDISMIVHLAASADVPKGTANTMTDIDQGTMLTYHVLEAARKCDVPELIFSSSSVVYGTADRCTIIDMSLLLSSDSSLPESWRSALTNSSFPKETRVLYE